MPILPQIVSIFSPFSALKITRCTHAFPLKKAEFQRLLGGKMPNFETFLMRKMPNFSIYLVKKVDFRRFSLVNWPSMLPVWAAVRDWVALLLQPMRALLRGARLLPHIFGAGEKCCQESWYLKLVFLRMRGNPGCILPMCRCCFPFKYGIFANECQPWLYITYVQVLFSF